MIDWLIALSQLDNYSAIMSDVQKPYNGVYVAKADRPDSKEGLTLFGDFFFLLIKNDNWRARDVGELQYIYQPQKIIHWKVESLISSF